MPSSMRSVRTTNPKSWKAMRAGRTPPTSHDLADMTLQTALLQGTRLLEAAGVAVPRLTAEVLLAHALHCERVYLYAHPERQLTEVDSIHHARYLQERLHGNTTHYITQRPEP